MNEELFQQWVNSLAIDKFETRSSTSNPKYYTTGAIKPAVENREIDGVMHRASVSLSITYLPVKASDKNLKSVEKAASKLTPEQKRAKAEEWLAELDETAA